MKHIRFEQRRNRVRAKVIGTESRPRLHAFRSLTGIYGQIINDEKGVTMVSVSSKEIKDAKSKVDVAFKAGELIAEKAKKAKITQVVFDKSGYKYHGRIKAFADGARKGGLSF
jgi:large subunit ribosomal protein L18